MRIVTKIKQGLGLLLVGVLGTILSACYNGDAIPASNTVNASLTQTWYTAAVGESITVPVTFNTNTGTASSLQIALSSLPAGWSLQGGGLEFSCDTINSTGNGCQMNLIYTPTAATAPTSFTLNYNYRDNNHGFPQGNVSINYSATASGSTFAYVVNKAGGTDGVSVCSVSGTGALGDCQYTGSGINTNPVSVATATISGQSYAYVLYGSAPPTVTQCSIDSTTGALSSCSTYQPTGDANFTGDTGFTGVTFKSFNGTNYAYISGNYYDSQCSLNASTGHIESCGNNGNNMSPAFFSPNVNSIAFGTVSGNTYAYSAAPSSPDSTVYSCLMTSAGQFPSTCTSNSFAATSTTGIAVATAQNGTAFAYIPNGRYVQQCNISSDGSISSSACAADPAGVSAPFGITIEAVGGKNYAYIVDTTNSEVATCPINTDGSLGSCSPTNGGSSGTFTNPNGIGFFAP